MRSEKQIEAVRRVMAHLDGKTTDHDGPPSPLAARVYHDPARLAREEERLFRGMPVAVGHSSELRAPGDFLTHDATGVPLLVVRGDDGELSAFLNVCRHRGTRVEGAPCGSAKKAFVCPYHSWTYDRAGSLVGIPHEKGFGPVARAERSLVRVPVGEAAGMIFVRASRPAAGESLALDAAAHLGGIAEDLEGFGLRASHVYDKRDYVKECTWKLTIDIFLETYHLRPTHKDSIYPLFFDNVGLVDRVGPHQRNVFPKRSIRDLAKEPDDVVGRSLRLHANVLFLVFPNTLVLVQPDHAAVLSVFPLGPTRTRLCTYTAIPEPALSPKARAYWDANNRILYDATDEDFRMGESIQKNLRESVMGANGTVLFGSFEHALTHFHAEVARRVD